MLYNRFTGTERARNSGGTAFGDWEQGVDDALSGDHREIRRQLLLVWTLYTDRPSLQHADVVDVAVFILDLGDGLGDVVAAGIELDDLTLGALGHHDPVGDNRGLLNGAQHVAHHNLVADLGGRDKVPFLFVVQRGHFDASGDIASGNFPDLGQRTLDAVEDAGQHAGSQLDGQRSAGGLDHVARTDACGLLVYLNGCLVLSHFDDFTDEPLFAYAHNVGHIGVTHVFGNDQRTGNLYNFALAQYFHLL